jgi:hypothetical protein
MDGFAESALLETASPYVCVSSGHHFTRSEDPWGCFSEGLASAIDFLIQHNVPVLVRLHPHIAARTVLARLVTIWIRRRFGAVRIDNPRQVSLKDSIATSFLNLAVHSATWFEFALSGKPTVFLDQTWANHYRLHAESIQIWKSGESPVVPLKSLEEFLEYVKVCGSSKQVLGLQKRKNLEDFIEFLR